MIVPIDQKKVLKILDERGVVAVVGVYGSGKGLISEWIEKEMRSRGEVVLRVSLKDLPKPAESDIPQLFGQTSWATLHNHLRKNIVIMIDEAQQLMEAGDKLWEIFTSLRYYQKDLVKIVLLGQPLMLHPNNIHLRRLLSGNVVYPRQLRESEAREYLGKTKYGKVIYQISHAHFGSIKYIPQLIKENNFDGQRLTESQVIKWARERGDMDYFVAKVWEGMSQTQQLLVRQYLANHGKVMGDAQELLNTGILWRGGGRLNWCVPWTLLFVCDFVMQQVETKREIGDKELKQLGEKGRRLLMEMLKHKNMVVKYGDLADVIWGEEGEYSLWALSRLAGRVKEKLSDMGYGGAIENVRGVGYRWDES